MPRDSVGKKLALEEQIDTPDKRRQALLRLLAEDPQGAAKMMMEMGVSPEDFIAIILDTPQAEGLSFDVDEQELATSMDKIEFERGAGPTQLGPSLEGEGRTKDDQAPPSGRTRQGESTRGPVTTQSPNPFRELWEWFTKPSQYPERGPSVEQAPTPAPAPATSHPTALPPAPPSGVRPPNVAAPAPVAPAPVTGSQPTEPAAPGYEWFFEPISKSWRQIPANGTPRGTTPAPPTTTPNESGPISPPPPMAGSDGTASTQGVNTGSGMPNTAAEAAAMGAAYAPPSAAPQDAGTGPQSTMIKSLLAQALMGVSDSGDPNVQQVATPAAPGGADPIQQMNLLQILGRLKAGGGAPSLGQSLALKG